MAGSAVVGVAAGTLFYKTVGEAALEAGAVAGYICLNFTFALTPKLESL